MTTPRVRRRLVAVWLVLTALVALVVVTEDAGLVSSPASPTTAVESRSLLPVSVDELGAVEIADRGALHRFERDAEGTWFYHGRHGAADADHTHAADPATSERIEGAVRAFGRARIEREVAGEAAAYGVTTPAMVILVYRRQESRPLAQYAVGDVAPDTVSRYVDVVGGAGVVTIPTYQIDNLRHLVESVQGSAGGAAGPTAVGQ